MRLCYTGPNNQHTKRWVNAFVKRGHEVHLVVDDPQDNDESMDYNGVIVHPLNLIQKKTPQYFLKKLFILRHHLKKIQADILHAHYLTGEGYIGALTGFHPFVVTIWGNDIYIRPYTGFDERMFTKYTLRKADLITADSQDQISTANRLGGHQSKSAVIQWGVDLTHFKPDQHIRYDIRARLGIGDNPLVINQRSCLPLYNVDIIVQAFSDMLRVLPDAHLLITGGGSMAVDKIAEAEIQTMVRQLGIEDRVHFTGYLPYDELPAYISAADVTVSVPSSDGTAMSLLEGMACGAVPIVSDLPSNREWITDGINGHIVPVRDRAALADRLINLLQNREQCRLFEQRNIKIIKERADHQANMETMEHLYIQLVERRRQADTGRHTTRFNGNKPSGMRHKIKPFGSPRNLLRIVTASLRDVAHTNDRTGNIDHDMYLREAAQWLVRAQKIHGDGGCAKCFNLLTNTWEPSYPETSGYIILTFLDLARHYREEIYRNAAKGIGAWLLTLQLETGAFPWIDLKTPVVFDTGQILHGLISLWQETEDIRYLEAAHRAANWLTQVQEADGSWIRHEYRSVPHAYNTLVSWALLRIWSETNKEQYRTTALRQLEWACYQQQSNGWFKNNSLHDPARPILHTIVYVIQGLLESGMILQDKRYIDAARLTARTLAEQYQRDHTLSGAYNENWQGVVSSRCLTGEAQLAGVWLRLLDACGEQAYKDPAIRVNSGLKRIQNVTTLHPGVRGGIQGSFPIYGSYMTFKYPNWAAKYYIDSLLMEADLAEDTSAVESIGKHSS